MCFPSKIVKSSVSDLDTIPYKDIPMHALNGNGWKINVLLCYGFSFYGLIFNNYLLYSPYTRYRTIYKAIQKQ